MRSGQWSQQKTKIIFCLLYFSLTNWNLKETFLYPNILDGSRLRQLLPKRKIGPSNRIKKIESISRREYSTEYSKSWSSRIPNPEASKVRRYSRRSFKSRTFIYRIFHRIFYIQKLPNSRENKSGKSKSIPRVGQLRLGLGQLLSTTYIPESSQNESHAHTT